MKEPIKINYRTKEKETEDRKEYKNIKEAAKSIIKKTGEEIIEIRIRGKETAKKEKYKTKILKELKIKRIKKK